MNAIEILATSLRSDLRVLAEDMQHWGDLPAMERALAQIRKKHKSASAIPSHEDSRSTIERFVTQGHVTDRKALRILSYGLCLDVLNNAWSIIASPVHLELTLGNIHTVTAKQRLGLLLGLCHSYLSFPKYAQPSDAALTGWDVLREFLGDQVSALNETLRRRPRWFECLRANLQVFGPSPGELFGAQIASGDEERFREFVSFLSVPGNSWLIQDVLLGHVRAVCNLDDQMFLKRLEPMLSLFSAASSARPSEQVSRRGIGMLLHRYAQIANPIEHDELRDLALSLIGNPWLRSQFWAHDVLRPDGSPSHEAQAMVTSWLKQRLIRDFFEVLASDRAAEPRRLSYWLRHEKAIEDLWLFLGDDVWFSVRDGFKEIRKRADGRVMHLINAQTAANNAFGMKINGLWIIEFGQTGNACFVYREKEFPGKLESGGAIRGDSGGLKVPRVAADRLLHFDRGSNRWEREFDRALGKYGLQREPSRVSSPARKSVYGSAGSVSERGTGGEARSATTPPPVPSEYRRETLGASPTPAKARFIDLEELGVLKEVFEFEIRDNRQIGGALWVDADDSSAGLRTKLSQMGFVYKQGRGWWFKGS